MGKNDHLRVGRCWRCGVVTAFLEVCYGWLVCGGCYIKRVREVEKHGLW